MRFRAVVCTLLLVAVATGSAVALDRSSTRPAQAATPTDSAGTDSVGADANTTIAIQPHPDGDARFRISTTFRLDGTNETAAFRALAREFEAGEAGVSVAVFRRAAAAASNATGRPMTITNVTRNATIVGENTNRTAIGTLVLEFTWTNFAETRGDRLVVGDVFNTTRGTWLPGLTADQTLLIETPRRYVIIRSPPVAITNRTLRWEGPEQFAPGSPTVVYERRGPPVDPPGNISNDGNGGNGGESDGTGPNPSRTVSPLVVGGVLTLVVVAVLGAYAWSRRERWSDESSTTADGTEHATEPVAVTGEPAETDGTGTDAAAVADEELLSDEERVERLLGRNDGRMKQASIVTETGWSNAKVSQLLSAMDDAGRINKLRIGRENLISLPDEEQ